MRKTGWICGLLLLIGYNSQAGAFQGIGSLESSIQAKEPGWQLFARETQPASTIYRWKSGKEIVTAEVYVTVSTQAAVDVFHQFGMRIPVPPKTKLGNLGEEALLFQSDGAPHGTILFRKAQVFVAITGSSIVDTKRFAQHIADLVTSK